MIKVQANRISLPTIDTSLADHVFAHKLSDGYTTLLTVLGLRFVGGLP